MMHRDREAMNKENKNIVSTKEVTQDKNKNKDNQKNIIIRLFKYAGPYKYLSVIGALLTGTTAITGILPVYYIWKVAKEVITTYPNYQESDKIVWYAWLAVIWACLTMLIYLAGLLMCHLSAFRIARNLRELSLKHLMSLPLGYFTSNGSGKLRQIIDECAASTETLLAHNLPDLVAACVSPFAIFGILFLFDWRLGVVSLVPIVLSILAMATMFLSKDMAGKMGEKQQVLENMNNEAIEFVRGIPVVKTFGQTVFSFKRFHDAIMKYNDFAAEISIKGKIPMIGFEALINSVSIFLTIAGIIIIGTESVMNDFLIMFLFGVFLIPLCTSVMYKIMFSSHNTILSENSLNRIERLLKEEALEEPSEPKKPTTFDITFENVSFKYPENDTYAVDHVNLTIPEGSTYGLVGPSGGGKSTLATLIPRFFDVVEGSVKIGGVDVREIENKELMKNISFVFQQTSLYKMSIFDNVRESKPEATREEVLSALEAARCMSFINELPNGIDTIYGTKGTYLSGGEAQRIAIARAILKDAPIVLLDEATSFTDPENEFEIKKAFEKLTHGKTVLMIAHRLTSIQNADKICFLAEGKILESGTHEELLAQKGEYSSLYKEYQTAFLWNQNEGQGVGE